MNKEELYNLALSDVHKYSLLNEILAITDARIEEPNYTIAVEGFISLDVLNKYIDMIQELDKYKSYTNITAEEGNQIIDELKQELDKYKNMVDKLINIGNELEMLIMIKRPELINNRVELTLNRFKEIKDIREYEDILGGNNE